MSFSTKKRSAVFRWVETFSQIPSSVFTDLAKSFPDILSFSDDRLRLISTPYRVCGSCSYGEEELNSLGVFVCAECGSNDWVGVFPSCFPCMWSTLFSPTNSCDNSWMIDNAVSVSSCGVYVFDSEYFGCVLGIDGAGYDFYEDHWNALYELRGLKWHE